MCADRGLRRRPAVRAWVRRCRWPGGVPARCARPSSRALSGWCRLEGFPLLGFVVVMLQFFALGSWGEPGRAVVAATRVGGVRDRGRARCSGRRRPVAAIGGVIVGGAARCWPGGWSRHQQRAERRARPAGRASSREERSRAEEAAVDAERARIAQELHDVVGHEVTLIAVQAEAAAAALRLGARARGRAGRGDPGDRPPHARRDPRRPRRAGARRATCAAGVRRPDARSPGAPSRPASPNTLAVTGAPAARPGAGPARGQPDRPGVPHQRRPARAGRAGHDRGRLGGPRQVRVRAANPAPEPAPRRRRAAA